jgi:regulator of protease activity HflC (stomatin/prohibitin superfamily)
MLRDIQLPEEYAKGLETLLLKKQENDRMGVETELKQKQVRIAELEAEATKVQQIKQAEGEAQVHVLQAKGESDATEIHAATEGRSRSSRAGWKPKHARQRPFKMQKPRFRPRSSTAKPRTNGGNYWRQQKGIVFV